MPVLWKGCRTVGWTVGLEIPVIDEPCQPPPCPVASAHHDTMAYAASITRLDTVHPSPTPHDMINRGPLLSPTNDNRPENGGKRRGGGALLLRDETEICLLFFPVFFCFFFFFFLHVFKEKNKGISERSETKICSSSFVTYFFNVLFFLIV